MGCVVNGPGESKHADIGISLPGTAEEPRAPVYVDGALRITLKGDTIVADFLRILDQSVETRCGGSAWRCWAWLLWQLPGTASGPPFGKCVTAAASASTSSSPNPSASSGAMATWLPASRFSE